MGHQVPTLPKHVNRSVGHLWAARQLAVDPAPPRAQVISLDNGKIVFCPTNPNPGATLPDPNCLHTLVRRSTAQKPE
ncbi:hypothetical protein PMI30_05097 [Pseudomonas sp. GM50]|nr:hypothetical protein PMI30_05097 [Pseudomonas sp. GM50]